MFSNRLPLKKQQWLIPYFYLGIIFVLAGLFLFSPMLLNAPQQEASSLSLELGVWEETAGSNG